MGYKITINEFFIEGADRRVSHVLLHITEPQSAKEWARGYFFALVEITHGSDEQVHHMQEIIETLEAGWYEDDADGAKDAFEATLAYLNRRSGMILVGAGALHCMVGVIQENRIRFAYHGSPVVSLYVLGTSGYKTVELIDIHPTADTRLFSSLLEGSLEDGDVFFAATPSVMDFFSKDRLEKIIGSRSPKEGAAHIEKVLRDLRDDHSFGGMCISAQKSATAKSIADVRGKAGSQASLEHLLASEQKTAETLSPPLLGGIGRLFSETQKTEKHKRSVLVRQSAEINYRTKKQPGETLTNTVLVGIGRALVAVVIQTARVAVSMTLSIWKLAVVAIILITNKNNGRSHIVASMRRKIMQGQAYISRMPLLSKILFLGALLFAGSLIASVVYIRAAERLQEKRTAYDAMLLAVTEKKNEADASMIYNNDEKAFLLLQETAGLIDALPADNKKQRESQEELHRSVRESMQKIQKITPVAATALASLETQATGLVSLGNTLIAFGGSDKKAFVINRTTGHAATHTHETIGVLESGTTPKEDETAFFLTVSDTIAAFEKETQTFSAKDISFDAENHDAAGGYIYNTRLYLLDKKNNQITRHNPTKTGFDKGSNWLLEPTDMVRAVNLAVDGDVYVIFDNGQIKKFTKGVEQPFATLGLDPVLTAPTAIWTHNDAEHLYILETERKRIVVVSKSGKLIAQYTSDAWNHPTDFIVDEEAREGFIVDGNTVYRFPLP